MTVVALPRFSSESVVVKFAGVGVAVGVALAVGVGVGGTGVAVCAGVGVGGTGVAVCAGVGVGGTGVAVCAGVGVGGSGVAVCVGVGGPYFWCRQWCPRSFDSAIRRSLTSEGSCCSDLRPAPFAEIVVAAECDLNDNVKTSEQSLVDS